MYIIKQTNNLSVIQVVSFEEIKVLDLVDIKLLIEKNNND